MAMTLRLDDELADALRSRATADGRSVHQTVLLAIDEYLKRRQRGQRIESLATQAAADYPEVLRRLGE
jgi:predicted transcriptional regulator